ncbi:MAG: hypothetical protein SFV20_09025 [Sphingopyxis sp.]|nr:hypothetical protein [Sphingopyxis sp.]
MTENEPLDAPRRPSFVWTSTIIIATAFLTGAVAGYFDKMAEYGEAPRSGSLIAQLVVIALGVSILVAYLSRFGRFWENWSRRKQLYAVSLSIAALLGFITTLALRFGVGDGPTSDLFGNGRFDPGVAMILSALWLVGMTLSILIYHRSVDDHEKQAYLWGGLAGFYAVVFPAPVWWLLARAQIVPPVDAMILFLFAVTANAIVYMWLKYR